VVKKESKQDMHGKEILERNVDDGLQVQREEDLAQDRDGWRQVVCGL